ncbi:MAG: type II toxin-antitoxin system VapC family toxin [Acidobacteria bacterium]|nr:type II toxin-antitoxin system VapC family toxin [Acidobacteriota bacterium]MCI0724587.1 type II toxin-antitoxin system VapC family toxin [Acidobacteriota bacterium]
MILIDSNIPMYLVGEQHPLKARAMELCQQLAAEGRKMVADAEVMQEILHRYSAIQPRDAIQPCFDALYGLVDEILPITEQTVLEARGLLLGCQGLSARDAIHAAIMREHRINDILSFDAGFDSLAPIRRLC